MVICYSKTMLETMASKNIHDLAVLNQAIRSLGKLSEILTGPEIYVVSSLIRDTGTHITGRSIDISAVVYNNSIVRYSDLTDNVHLKVLHEKLIMTSKHKDLISQILCPYGVYDIRLGNKFVSWDKSGKLINMRDSHQDHLHLTFMRGKV